MPYTALPDHRIPYDNDGTVCGYKMSTTIANGAAFAEGIAGYLTSGDRIELNDFDYTVLPDTALLTGTGGIFNVGLWWFFPEQREVTAAALSLNNAFPTLGPLNTTGAVIFKGSNNTANGTDGTWETASLPSGAPTGYVSLDTWRANIKAISFTGGKRTLFLEFGSSVPPGRLVLAHLYGEKTAGQTPDDIIYLDPDNADAEFPAAYDFGDRPLGTSSTKTFKVKNASPTKTANTINIQCNDGDFVISTDNVNWVTTINIASLAAGAKSATMYIRNTTPAAGNLLGPRFARIVTTVASYT